MITLLPETLSILSRNAIFIALYNVVTTCFILTYSLDLNIIFYLIIIIICYDVFIAFNINHSSILPLMAPNSLYCADVPLSNYSLTHSRLLDQWK